MKLECLPLFAECAMGHEVSDLAANLQKVLIDRLHFVLGGEIDSDLHFFRPFAVRKRSDILARSDIPEQDTEMDEHMLRPTKECLNCGDANPPCFLHVRELWK